MKKLLLHFSILLLILNTSIYSQSATISASCNTSEAFDLTVCDSLVSPTGKVWDTTGVYIDTILNSSSCDSIMFFNLTITNPTPSVIDVSVCDSLFSPTGKVWNTSGTYYDTISNSLGCDSLLTYNLTVGTQILDTISETSCDSLVSPTGKVWSVTGIYNDTIFNVAACDTILIYDLTINNATTASVDASVCDSLISPTGKVWNSTGVYMDTINNSPGCDSIITFNLTVGEQILDTIEAYACDTLISPSGKIWTSTGIYNDTVLNPSACDSIFVYNLYVGGMLVSLTDTVCDSTLSPSGNETYTSSGTYQDTVLSSLGCDSIVYTYNLQVYSSYTDTLTISDCDTAFSPISNNYWTSTGIYLDTVLNSQGGCDSTILYDVTIGNSYGTANVTSCRSFTTPGGKTYTQSGRYYDTVITSGGCDSITYYTLEINIADTTASLSNDGKLVAFVSGANYQWLDCNNSFAPVSGETSQTFTPTTIGSYAVEVSNFGCIDTSSCISINSLASIQENNFGENMYIFPNPTNSDFTIVFGDIIDDLSVSLLDVTGKVVLARRVLNERDVTFNLNNYDIGTYFVKIEHNNFSKTIKVIRK